MQDVDAAGLAVGEDHPPRIMGVLNVSEESPYDPSVFTDPAEAAAYIDEQLVAEGADIVDVGLASANKRFEPLSEEEELARLDRAVEAVASASGDAVYSIETRYAEVAAEALDRGFDMVNDVCGFADPEMPAVCRERDAAVVKMASPPDLTRPGAVEGVDAVYEALERGGLTEKTIVDPAFGGWSEAKTLADDRETFRRLREFRGLGRPILVSINRKNFLGDVVDRPTEERLPVSLGATAMAVERGASVVRTHDVAATRDAALVGRTFARERLDADGDGATVAVEELDVTTPGEAARHLDRLGAAADPAGAVCRTYELSGLSAADRDRLHEAARRNGATLAVGSRRTTGERDAADAEGRPVLLFGTAAALDRTATDLADGDGGLAAAASKIHDFLQ